MWVIKLRVNHDCSIGNRCKKFGCTSQSLPLSHWRERDFEYTSHRHTIIGDAQKVKRFIIDLRKDARVIDMESSKNTVFLVEKRKGKDIPTSHYHPKMFFIKPVYVEKDGTENWELASTEKSILMRFLSDLQHERGVSVKLEKIHQVNLDTIFFPKIMPNLSEKQKDCFQLAVSNGYYSYPRKINLHQLARLAKISASTFQQHLRRAEEKLMPTFS